MLGVKQDIAGGIITQHAFVTEILGILYPARELQIRVRDTLKAHRNDRSRLKEVAIVDSSRYPLWDLYLTKQDAQIKKILGNYIQAVKDAFQDDWGNRERILSKTTGYQALMSQLRRLIPEGIRAGNLSTGFFRP